MACRQFAPTTSSSYTRAVAAARTSEAPTELGARHWLAEPANDRRLEGGQIARSNRRGAVKRATPKPSKEKIEMMSTVMQALKGTQFIVELDNGHEVLAYPCGKMRKYYIRLLLGDRVKVEISPYDLTRARITYRYKRVRAMSRR